MTVTRRKAIGLLGVGAGLGFASRLGVVAQGRSVIRTLLTDVAPETIDGPILFHEHLSIRYPMTRALALAQGRPVPVSFSDDVELMIAETKAAGADGVRCIVDGGHPDMDRDLDALKKIAAGSGVHIVASGGFYMQRNYPADIATKSADQIADDLVRDAKAQRLGAFGEIGQQGGGTHRR
jgi:predicted metal-dependent phosphotriesterase family hydrolase